MFWRHALFVLVQSFSVKIFDRSRSGYQVIRLRAGDAFCWPSGQAFPLPSSVFLSRAVLSCVHYFQAPTTQKVQYCNHTPQAKRVIKPKNQWIYAMDAFCEQLSLVLRKHVSQNCTELLREQ